MALFRNSVSIYYDVSTEIQQDGEKEIKYLVKANQYYIRLLVNYLIICQLNSKARVDFIYR